MFIYGIMISNSRSSTTSIGIYLYGNEIVINVVVNTSDMLNRNWQWNSWWRSWYTDYLNDGDNYDHNHHLLGSRVALSSSHSHQKWGLVLKSALVQTILVWFGSNHLAGFGVPDFRFESHYQGPLSSGSKLYRSFNILTTPSSLYRSEWDWDCLGFFLLHFFGPIWV